MKKIRFIFLLSLIIGVGAPSYSLATEKSLESSEIVEVIKKDNEVSDTEETVTEETAQSEVEQTNENTSKEVVPEEVVPKIEEGLDKLIGEKKGENVPVDEKPSPSQIRETLLSGDFGVSKEELDNYTDEQLEQTMTLFTRYNYDVTGMDYGAYGRLLKTLFNDKTVNVNDALTQLAFDPSSFSSFSSMIPEVERLKTYLDTLYPVNSSFIPGLGLSTNQLVERLNELQKLEDKLTAEGKQLPFGRIAPLISTSVTPTEETGESTTDSTSQTKESVSESKVINSSDKKNDKSLPKTGEASTGVIGILGLALMALVAVPLSKKF
ncbi:LPXTG cell wall anchor domain-containing protein [Vagococcus fluvialis]|uniref:LPXTG cell wall anchor domain-containing protein n=1 Tax=Vagococcus fluvialis TaxID=2738 RepID=UPI003B5CB62C